MDSDRWQRLNEIFHAALSLDSAARLEFISRSCAGDEPLRVESEELLRAHERAVRDLGAIERLEISLDEPDSPSLVGHRLGPYQISEEIGRGGMGAVWVADRVDGQFEQRVAIKVIKRGMDTAQVLERFRAERQILASFDHPNIARLIDGGTTEDGLPYFVMEHIQGQPIDEYADARRLSVRERLELFLPVCDAISYAHRHLIVHRDIKPQNILVTTAGVPKLLDFGIAKMLQEAREQGTHTLSGFHLLTPDYASPEQVEGRPTTTQTDVYSLGVVLYELLTGRSPYRPRTWSTRDLCESVLSSDVERPSTAVSRPADVTATRRRPAPNTDFSLATAGNIDRLRGQLRGDLDAIVMSALRKEPARRYPSVEQFAADIRRYLNGLPVRARPDSIWYRGSKFVRRNAVATVSAALIVLSLLGGIVATAWQAHRARAQETLAQAEKTRAERRFNEVRQLARAVLFDYHDAIKDLPGATAVRERLVRDGLTYLDSLAGESHGDPELQRELAAAYERLGDVRGQTYSASLGDVAGAQESYLKALEIREALVAAQPQDVQSRRDLARSYVRIGSALIETSEAARATEYLRQGVAAYLGLAGEEPADAEIRYDLAGAYNDLGLALEHWGDTSGALENQRKALVLREQLVAADPSNQVHRRNLAATYMNLSRALVLSGDPESALESNQKALTINAALLAEHPDNASYRRRLAISYQNDGDYRSFRDDTAGALESFRRKLALDEQSLADDPANAQSHGDLGYTCERLGVLLGHSGQDAQAVQYYRRAVASYEEVSARSPQNLIVRYRAIVARAALAETQAKLGQRADALAECSRAIALLGEMAEDPTHSAQRGMRGLVYLHIARAYAALAASRNAATAEQREHWRAARDMYARSLAIWQDMQQRGILTGEYATKPQEVAQEIAKCESFL